MNVWDKLSANAYRNLEPVPDAPRKPRLMPDATPDQLRSHGDALEAYDVAMTSHREQMAAYHVLVAQLWKQNSAMIWRWHMTWWAM
jgi:hypothetical protein